MEKTAHHLEDWTLSSMQKLGGALLWFSWKRTECVLWVAGRSRATDCERDCYLGNQICCLFFLGAQIRLYLPVSLVGRHSQVANFSPVECEWKQCVPVSDLSHKNVTCAVFSYSLSLSIDWLQIWQECSRASVLTWVHGPYVQEILWTWMGKALSLFSLTLHWNLAFLSIMKANNKP